MESRTRVLARKLLGKRLYPHVANVRAALRRRTSATERRRLELTEAFVREHGGIVRGGPFAGMEYVLPGRPLSPMLVQMLLGAYERELHAVLESAIAEGYDTMVNVGAAGGYYAVGFARASPTTEVWAFEINDARRRRLAEVARANGVEGRVHVEPRCDPARLQALPDGRTFLFSDCEGCEVEVLQPDSAPMLRGATLVVELHDDLRPGSSREVLARFTATHDLELVEDEGRDPADYPALQALDPADARILIDPYRLERGRWAVLVPRDR